MPIAFTLVLLSIVLGDVATAALAVPVPGAVLGLVGAAVFFGSRGGPTSAMGGMFDALIPYAPMLFVPAGAGVVANLDLIATSWLPIAAVITLGTAGALLATGLAAQLLLNRIAPVEAARWPPSLDAFTGHPLFGLALTIGVYLGAMRLHRATAGNPLFTPVLISVLIVGVVIWATGIEYSEYFVQASPLHYALGILVVLLAVPLVRRWSLIRAAGSSLMLALFIGSAVAVALAVWLPLGLGTDAELIASMAPKSATAPVAVGISERIGGIAGVTAMVAVLTGIFGAVAGPGLLAAAGIRDDRAAGFALGLASHAIGTARAFQISETAGAFASIGMILNALLTVLLAPLLFALLTP